MYKILGTDNKEYGPVTADQVRQWIAERRLHAQSLAQTDAAPSWKPLSSYPEFISALASAPPPPTLAGAGAPRPGYAPPAANNQLAVWSLVCGCIGLACCPVTSIAALILGIVALSQINSNPQEGRGLAIAGIVLGCIGLVTGFGLGLLFTLGNGLSGLGH
jgi:hypothetical protein